MKAVEAVRRFLWKELTHSQLLQMTTAELIRRIEEVVRAISEE